jgi:hypothetical protein
VPRSNSPIAAFATWEENFFFNIGNSAVMRFLAIVCLAILVPTPLVSAAQDFDTKAALRSLPNETTASLVLTPQGAERLASPARSEGQLSLLPDFETPGHSRALSLGIRLAAEIAWLAMGASYAVMPPAPTAVISPGSNSWQRIGCKWPEDCLWPRDPRD